LFLIAVGMTILRGCQRKQKLAQAFSMKCLAIKNGKKRLHQGFGEGIILPPYQTDGFSH
jgi:hypothetical protein